MFSLKRNLPDQLLLLVDDALEPAVPEPEVSGRVPETLTLEPELDRDAIPGLRGLLQVVGRQDELDLGGHLESRIITSDSDIKALN